MTKIPPTWLLTKLVDYIPSVPTGVKSYIGKRKYYSTGSISGKNYLPEGEYEFHNRPSRANRVAKAGDVLQARMKGTDKPLIIQEILSEQLFSTGFLQFRPIKDTYSNRLLFYFIRSDFFLKQKDEFATGSTQVALTDSKAAKLELIVPPLNEQHRIVTKLEKLLQKVDSCKERLDKIPTILKRFRQSILSAACSGELTSDWRKKDEMIENDELPADWKWTETEKLLPKKSGIFDGPFGSNLKTADYTDSGVRVIRLENIGHLRFTDKKESYISNSKYQTLTKHTVGEGDIIFASFIADETRVCILPFLKTKAIAKADCFCLRPKEDMINRMFFTFQLASHASYNALKEKIHGVTRPRINTKQLRQLKIRICPLPEQSEIVRRVEALFKIADQIEERYNKARAYVDKLTQSILAKAFRGELVPRDPNDEPASELLKRIKEEKVKTETKAKSIKRGRKK